MDQASKMIERRLRRNWKWGVGCGERLWEQQVNRSGRVHSRLHKKIWGILNEDLMKCGCNASFLTLISKVENLVGLNDLDQDLIKNNFKSLGGKDEDNYCNNYKQCTKRIEGDPVQKSHLRLGGWISGYPRKGLELEMQGRRVIVFQLTAEETMKELDVLSGWDRMVKSELSYPCLREALGSSLNSKWGRTDYQMRWKREITYDARKHVLLGGSSYLAFVVDSRETVANVPVVGEFPDVFPDDLSDISHERQVEFRIKLIPGVVSVAKTCTG
ncbi:hypothetical protein OSB04_021810 [Centaurea solstitialis]|uniref:Uncharacterized protein n=1 Tax=Centaurea solstitialis TaxID=347529 RepID=A0AA38TD98_9ASTR|nr:hypothetical protein OSB04_021810 [Centaurea solstitialis]